MRFMDWEVLTQPTIYEETSARTLQTPLRWPETLQDYLALATGRARPLYGATSPVVLVSKSKIAQNPKSTEANDDHQQAEHDCQRLRKPPDQCQRDDRTWNP